MKRGFPGTRAFILQALLHLTQGKAEERLVYPLLLTGKALPHFQVPHAELEIPGHNEVTQDQCNADLAEMPWEDPVSSLVVCHPAKLVSQLVSSCLTSLGPHQLA